ncbi:epidermal differentiation family protein [Salix suchowensis]|nr:epidermal differentiation family protein [Salix suchowensis]
MTSKWNCGFVVQFVVLSDLWWPVSGLGSMSSIAISYGEKGPAFCGIKSDGSHLVNCYGSNSAIIHETPAHFPFIGLTAGDGFVCGLLLESNRPYCWGSSGYLRSGVPRPMMEEAEYVEISAGDYHLCGLRKPLTGRRRNLSLIDCWGYNMTRNHVFDGQIQSISAGSVFNCGLFSENRTVFCWGDESSSRVISLIPQEMRFQKIAAGGYHVCGILVGVNSRAFCWGRSLDLEGEISAISAAYLSQGNVDLPPSDPMLSVVGGKFHACGIKSYDGEVICWGYIVKPSTPTPTGIKFYGIAAGNYFTCGILAEKSLLPVCWGLGFPTSLPLAVSPGLCKTTPCPPGSYEFVDASTPCKSPGSRACLSAVMAALLKCTRKSDALRNRIASVTIIVLVVIHQNASRTNRFWSLQLPVIIAELGFAVFLVVVVTTTAILYVRYRLRNCQCSAKQSKTRKNSSGGSSTKPCSFAQLAGYCEEGGERLLVYEFMAHGSLHQHLHGKSPALKEQLNWVRRVTIAVQAARGIEYLHGYACPPVIHRDIKSSNILIDEEHNARVSDFGLSLLGPANSSSPLAELPAGTLGYLDPEYYRLHYLTTKSDVYSFGVLLLEILIPLIRAGDISAILDPVLKLPSDPEALKRIANVACKCVRMRGKERPSMDIVTTALERALAQLMGSPCNDQPILPTEVVLGSSRLHKNLLKDLRADQRNLGYVANVGDGLRSLEEEIGPASPQERLFLQHNF